MKLDSGHIKYVLDCLKENTTDKKQKKYNICCSVIIVLMIILGFVLASGIVNSGTKPLLDAYNDSYSSEREEVYHEQYQKYFDSAEQEYHVSNRGCFPMKT